MIHSNGIITEITTNITLIDDVEIFSVQLINGYTIQYIRPDHNIQCRIILKFKDENYKPSNFLYANFCCHTIRNVSIDHFYQNIYHCDNFVNAMIPYTLNEKKRHLFPFIYNYEKKHFEIICGLNSLEWEISLHEEHLYVCWFVLISSNIFIDGKPVNFNRVQEEKEFTKRKKISNLEKVAKTSMPFFIEIKK